MSRSRSNTPVRVLTAAGALAFALAMPYACRAGIPSPEPRVGLRADPCAENPDNWQGNPWAWRNYDFGQRCRYRAENARLPPPTPRRAIFFGDSITESWLAADPALFTNDTLNRGISGQTSEQMLVRFRSDVIELKPGVVHIMAGTNDVAGNTGPTSLGYYQGSIRTMVEEALAHHIRVVLATIPPSAHIPWRPELERPAETVRTINQWLGDYARCAQVVFVDYAAVLSDPRGGIKPDLAKDDVHPTPAGYAAMSPLARAAISRALSQPPPAGLPSADCAAR